MNTLIDNYNMNNFNVMYYQSPLGILSVVASSAGVCNIIFGELKENIVAKEEKTPILQQTELQLNEYFSGERKVFTVPIDLKGTEFQCKVWNNLLKIPYGETRCYSEIARMTGNQKASRAVGMANNRNPIPIIIPCHRVIGKNGMLVGYAGGLEIKKYLLELEQANK